MHQDLQEVSLNARKNSPSLSLHASESPRNLAEVQIVIQCGLDYVCWPTFFVALVKDLFNLLESQRFIYGDGNAENNLFPGSLP